MRKVLLSSAALCGLAFAATPALAQEASPLKMDIGGFMKIYGVWSDQDVSNTYTGVLESRSTDIMRNTELHFSGETTLDNGLTVGLHFETLADVSDSLFVQESYLYMSGPWGRVNLGGEDGAAYLLQVAAPSADENIDGIRQYVQPVDYTLAFANAGAVHAFTAAEGRIFNGFGYDQSPTGYTDKITYLTPVLNGFQAGVSFDPDVGSNVRDVVGTVGIAQDNTDGSYGRAYEAAARYEGQFNELGFTLGAGYSHLSLERDANGATGDSTIFGSGVDNDDYKAWNAGGSLTYGPFGLGVVYKHDNLGYDKDADEKLWVVGADYTTGPFKLGASWLTQNNELGVGGGEMDTDRYTGGVVYTYGPGMTFRGAIQYIQHDFPTGFAINSGDNIDATSVLIGTQVLF